MAVKKKLVTGAAINSGKNAYDWSKYKSVYDANGDLLDTDWVDSHV